MKTKSPGKRAVDQYIRYTNIAFQMAIIIGAGVFGGLRLDQWAGWKLPVFTVLLALISVGIAIYVSIRDFIKKP